ncbi:tRNA:m(4)X modification enzyme TRM13 homolog isoform X2 [Brienomyrus brachyistius]|uniref:tRNA:m(4)X modification enzyme TRM13 homolog isoform X2 n=1 Tax=Brienomyrus brachyistius TaxID=42636 RepID=UPI0020B39254|nr:tRNA:m(4)X modification enzyme TRM13 homolog isoform X2 [Brienomyrus brachyistius]
MATNMEGDGVSAPLPGRCGFYVVKKRRYCKMIVGRGKAFCGEHANVEHDAERIRVPCPLDPKHTVYQDNLEKHLKKCNSREKLKPVYYIQDVNAGPQEDEGLLLDEVPLGERSKEELNLLIQKLNRAVSALCDALNDPKNGDCAFKHLKQQASLLGNMDALGLLGPERCFIEFGAGKGKLSHWIHVALQGSRSVHFMLVERSCTRFKVDGKHKNADVTFERLQVDIQHLCLRKVPFLQGEKVPVVGVGKHLCGAATDLALRCLLDSVEDDEESGEPPRKRVKQEGGAKRDPAAAGEVSGLAIALCCHHRCDWRHYVGKEFFRERGLGASEFAAFQRMSSWATCGLRKVAGVEGRPSVGEWGAEEHDQGEDAVPSTLNDVVSAEDRERVGRLCKLLIDYGRVHFLHGKGFASDLCYYTSKDVSLENVLLTAVPTSISS